MSSNNIPSRISLINLSKQLPFKIDNEARTELCFGESLIISCGHNDRNIYDVESDDSCSTKSDGEQQQLLEFPRKDYEIKNNDEVVPDEIIETVTETSSDNDFHIYFFPECNKDTLQPVDSKSSIVIVDGLPKINPAAKTDQQCMCNTKPNGKCICYEKNICDCEKSHTNSNCTCSKVDQTCLCKSDEPRSTCDCKENETCHCLSEPTPTCKCDIIKPCLCDSKEAISTCVCYNDPTITCGTNISHNSIPIIDGNFECIDKDSNLCTCDQANNLSNPEHCLCSKTNSCNCGNPNDCKCYYCCECEKPCICDYIIETNKEEKDKHTCQCNKNIETTETADKNLKLKKVKVAKDGYRWCHDVDPHHTYFDFGYGRHDKILPNDDIIQKVKILGLHNDDELKEIDRQEAETKMPKYKKAAVKPSLDCCSAVGGITINVETLGEDKNKFLVQVVSHSAKEGAKTSTKLVSIVDLNLHTLEENRIENIMKENVTKEKRSYMSICDTGYYNKITRICGERNIVKRLYHSYEDAHDFLLEGANIVLMRYFGLRRFKGSVKTKTVLIKGEICESIYVCQGVSQAIVNGKPLFVVKVERHIIEPNGFIQQTLTVLTLRGYMVSHEWSNHNYILHLNPLLNIIPEKDEIEQHEPLRGRWREDMQLMSDYLDFKSQRTSEGGQYISENGPLVETIRNYLQTLLLLKPKDALQFTRSYFNSALSSMDLPHDEYFENCGKHVRYFFFEE